MVVVALWLFSGGPTPLTQGWSREDHPKHHSGSQSDQVVEIPKQKGEGHKSEEVGHEVKPHGHEAVKEQMGVLAKRGRHMVLDLHCNACHLVEPEIRHEHHGGHEQIAPNLSFEGDKVRAEWLFDFLKGPHRIRPTVKARMPDFRLSDREALALTEHIITDLRDRTLPPLPGKFNFLRKVTRENLEAGRLLVSKDYLDCLKCHQLGEKKPTAPPEDWAPDLTNAGRRLNPEWMVRWLKDPQRLQRGTKMPSFFADAHSGPEDILGGDEDRQIIAIRDYLLSLGSDVPSGKYQAAKKRYPDVTTGEGWKLMAELNCGGCHDIGRMHERKEIAPPLAHEGSRVYRSWLLNFLKQPHTVRPQGYIIGTAARMPDLQLSDEEVKAITAYLMGLTYQKMPDVYTKYSSKEYARIGEELFTRLRCGACHRGVEKGKVAPKLQGPDLRTVARRLKAPHLVLWLKGGYQTVDTHPVVPNFNLSTKEVGAIVAYLMTLK
ncbi:MAG: c-type cytochrome [Candidatus Binatia bacterium]